MNNPFSSHAPMSRRCYLLQSIAPAVIFSASLIAMQLLLASTLPMFLGPLFALIALVIILVAASTNPLVVPLGGSTFAFLAYSFPNLTLPKLPMATGVTLALLCLAIVVTCTLYLTALTMRRRRDASTQEYTDFALPAVLYVGGMILACTLLPYGEPITIVIACLFLPVAIHCRLLLKPTSK